MWVRWLHKMYTATKQQRHPTTHSETGNLSPKNEKKRNGKRSRSNLVDEAHKSLRRRVEPTKEIHKILPQLRHHPQPHSQAHLSIYSPVATPPPTLTPTPGCNRVSALCTFVLLDVIAVLASLKNKSQNRLQEFLVKFPSLPGRSSSRSGALCFQKGKHNS